MSAFTQQNPVHEEFEVEEDRVARWRFDQFHSLGFGIEQSWLLTASKVDLHRTRSLVAAGCSLELAWKILL